MEGVPHRLINVREVCRERVERRVPLEAAGGEEEGVGQDEKPEQDGRDRDDSKTTRKYLGDRGKYFIHCDLFVHPGDADRSST